MDLLHIRDARITTATLVVLVVCIAVSGPVLLAADTASADHTDDGEADTYVATQGDACVSLATLGDGTEPVSEYYDYRSGSGTAFASYGTTQLQDPDVSQLFAYHGPEGESLVFLHGELDGGGGGGISMTFAGLPDGTWPVVDDSYENPDDRFQHDGSTARIDWMWAPNRTDGAAFRGIGGLEDGDAITVDPAFGEASYAHTERNWPHVSGDVEWYVRHGDAAGDLTSVAADEPLAVERGTCEETSVSAAATADASTVAVGDEVAVDGSASDVDGSEVESYEWTFGDGTSATGPTAEHSYDEPGTYAVELTVTAADGTADATSLSIEVTDPDDGEDSSDGGEDGSDGEDSSDDGGEDGSDDGDDSSGDGGEDGSGGDEDSSDDGGEDSSDDGEDSSDDGSDGDEDSSDGDADDGNSSDGDAGDGDADDGDADDGDDSNDSSDDGDSDGGETDDGSGGSDDDGSDGNDSGGSDANDGTDGNFGGDSGSDDGDTDESDPDSGDEDDGTSDDSDTDDSPSDGKDDGNSGGDDDGERADGDDLRVANLSVAEPTVGAGDDVVVTATFENTGSTAATTAALTVGNATVAEANVTVPAGESRTVSFTHQIGESGTYSVGVGSESATVNVVEDDASERGEEPDRAGAASPSVPGTPATLVFGVVGVVALLGVGRWVAQ